MLSVSWSTSRPTKFAEAVEAHERGRPLVSARSVAAHELGVTSANAALDLAAGTRLLVPLVGRVVAVEPSEAMRVEASPAVTWP